MGDAYDDLDAGRPEPHRCPNFHASPTLPEPRLRVLDAVAKERLRQIAKGYTPAHDDTHTLGGLLGYADNYRRRIPAHYHTASGRELARRRLIQTIAILVAAVEAMDRRAGR